MLFTKLIPFKNSSPFVVAPSLKAIIAFVVWVQSLLASSTPFEKQSSLFEYAALIVVFSKVEIDKIVLFVVIVYFHYFPPSFVVF